MDCVRLDTTSEGDPLVASGQGAGVMTEDQAAQIIELLKSINELLYWIIAAVCFVAGFLPVLSFFIGKGDQR